MKSTDHIEIFAVVDESGNEISRAPRERELVCSFTGTSDDIPVINKDEIEEGRFWSLTEIKENLGKYIFTTNFEKEFEMLG